MCEEEKKPSNFLVQIISDDVKNGVNDGKVLTRFPPEPNGFLHIGHAKAVCVNYGLAERFGGKYNLRFDDTNPEKEDTRFVESIKEDIRWLGFDWEDRLYFASDYFEKLYEWALQLIKDGKAYVDHLNAEQIREYRGTLTEAGKNSPYRDRSIEENLSLFEKMRKGEFAEGECVLRAKIDMASPNLNLRDPAIYRIKKAHHHRTGDKWCIYPMYDYGHGLSDAIEGVTHSMCSLEFEDHRPLYDWFIEQLPVPSRPRQYEFARLNLNHTVMSKRKLRRLVEEGFVNGWDDPRMPTLAGMRRRGYPPEAIRDFCEKIGVAKAYSTVDISMLYSSIRDFLNKTVPRYMAVFDPVKLIITNYPEGQEENVDALINPEAEEQVRRPMPFSRELFIERSDFMEDAPKKFFRLTVGKEVRLKFAYLVTCEKVIKDESGEITEIHCTYDPDSRGGKAPDGRKVKGTLHWVSAQHAKSLQVNQYEYLFTRENPEDADDSSDFTEFINPESLTQVEVLAEPALFEMKPGDRCQFERTGYFCVDTDSTVGSNPVFNKTIGLKDSWAKIQKKS